ncbi:MAG: hypothetical protein J6R88_01500 [Clostridia bacterium]|nr:hypothetical protein [Clostridia bacterium]
MIKLLESLTNYALTGHTSRYNEDGLTGQQLLIKSARTCKKCLETIVNVMEGINTAYPEVLATATQVGTTANGNLYELGLQQNIKIPVAKVDKINTFYFLFAEDGKSLIELSADINNCVLQGLEQVEKLSNAFTLLHSSTEEKVSELKTYLNGCEVVVFDDCALTVLELAGHSAYNVNQLVKAVNIVLTIVNNLNDLGLLYEDEAITTLAGNYDNGILEL